MSILRYAWLAGALALAACGSQQPVPQNHRPVALPCASGDGGSDDNPALLCLDDADCASGDVCHCYSADPISPPSSVCVGGNCRIDADCGPHGYCSPDKGSYGVVGYYCHTAHDRCVNDDQCPVKGGASQACVYGQRGYWSCAEIFPPG